MKPKKYSQKQAENIIKKSMKILNINNNMKTNPKIIKQILIEMKLNDFKTNYLPIKKLLKNIKTKPQHLKPLFTDIKKGLTTKHPAILEFLELALENNWLKKSKHIEKAIHLTLILEIFTAAMCNNSSFFTEIYKHIRTKEYKCGIDTKKILKVFFKLLKITHSLFGTLKIFSIDPLMIYFQPKFKKFNLNKKEIKNLYKNKEINFLEYKLLSSNTKKEIIDITKILKINIYEAGITEYKNGFKLNALSAHALAENIKIKTPKIKIINSHIFPENSANKFYQTLKSKKNHFPSLPISKKWMSLYETWNMNFLLGNSNNLDILFPKLFIPSTINAKNKNFMGARIISLWLTLNTIFFKKYEKKLQITNHKNKIEMAKAWEKINEKYALDLTKNETSKNTENFKKTYKKIFSKPTYNFLKLISTIFK